MGKLRLPETETEFRNALVDAAELGAQKALAAAGVLKQFISEREAVRKYGAIVKRWIDEGLVKPKQDGPKSMKRIDRLEIESVAKASNRATYMTTSERTSKTN
jgi:hypothetical protein